VSCEDAFEILLLSFGSGLLFLARLATRGLALAASPRALAARVVSDSESACRAASEGSPRLLARMLLRRLSPGFSAAAAAAAASAAASAAAGRSALCDAKKEPTTRPSGSPGWTYTNVGEAETDTVVREAMQRLSSSDEAPDAAAAAKRSAKTNLPKERKPSEAPAPDNPGWSYTNVGEAAADVVVREAMQRMRTEEGPAEAESQHPLHTTPPRGGGGLRRHLTAEQGLQRLKRQSTDVGGQQRYRAGLEVQILYVPYAVLNMDVGHLAVLVKDEDQMGPPTTFGFYGQGFRNGLPVVSHEPGVVVSPCPLYAKALANPTTRRQIMCLHRGELTADQAEKLNAWAEMQGEEHGGHLVEVRGHERGVAPMAGESYQGARALRPLLEADNCATWALRHFAPDGAIECPMGGSLPRLCRAVAAGEPLSPGSGSATPESLRAAERARALAAEQLPAERQEYEGAPRLPSDGS